MPDPRITFIGNASSVERAGAIAVGSINRVEGSTHRAGAAFQQGSKHAETFGVRLRDIAKITIGTLGAEKLVEGIKESINAAGDLEKQQQKVIRVFGDTPKVLEAFERTSAKAYGVSHLAALRAAASTGALLKNLGIGNQVASGMSVGVQKLAADMASFNNLPTARVAESVNRALLGQTRGLKSLGISLSAADVGAKAFAMGLVHPIKNADALRAASDRVTVAETKWVAAVRKHGRESTQALSAENSMIKARDAQAKATQGVVPPLTAAQRALATYALILERSKVQQGDFSRNADTLANKSKVLDAEFANLTDRVGEALVPAMKTLVDFMAGPGIAGANTFLTGFGKDARGLYSAIQPLGPAARVAGEGFKSLVSVSGLVPGVLAATIAYQGYVRAIAGGQAAIAGARGLIAGLTAPFAAGAGAAEAATIKYAGFGGQIRTVESQGTKGVSALRAFAGSTTGVGLAAGITVGTLVALSAAEESVGQKARAAAQDLLGLQNAQAGFAGSRTEATRTGLVQGDAARALSRARRDLSRAQDRAAQAEPDTAAGEARHARALADLTVKTRALAVAQNQYDAAHQAHVSAEQAVVQAREKVASSTDKAVAKIHDLAAANEQQARIAVTRGEPAAKVAIAQQEANAEALRRTTGAIRAQITANEEIRPKTAAGFKAILDLINKTKEIPASKTLSILLNDAATGKVKELRHQIALLEGKTVTIREQVRGTLFQAPPPVITHKATGDRIDRPMIAMLGEEAPAHPEFVIPTNPARRGRALDLINQMRQWIPGFDNGAGPPGSPALRSREHTLLSRPASSSSSSGSGDSSGSSTTEKKKPAWLKAFEATGLPGDSTFNNAITRATADLSDAAATATRTDDLVATHRLIKISARRLAALHGPSLRGAHHDSGAWQSAVNAEISSIGGQVAGYRSSLGDLTRRPSPDDVTVNVPSGIRWQIERAGFTEGLGDDLTAYRRKKAWLIARLAEKTGKGRKRKHKLTGATRIAYQRELARTRAEIMQITGQQDDAKDAADEQAKADAGTPPELPLSVQQALADAALTDDKGDDLAALQLEQATIAGQLAAATDPRVRVALTQDLAGVQDEIKSLTNASGTTSTGAPTDAQAADNAAVNQQLQNRLDVATRSASLSEAELAAFRGSGDIGTGGYASALQAGAGGPTPAMIILGDQRSAAAFADATVRGVATQSSVTATRQAIAI